MAVPRAPPPEDAESARGGDRLLARAAALRRRAPVHRPPDLPAADLLLLRDAGGREARPLAGGVGVFLRRPRPGGEPRRLQLGGTPHVPRDERGARSLLPQ